MEDITQYQSGYIEPNKFYHQLLQYYPALTGNDDGSALSVLHRLLKAIEEPEREASLQLRHYNSRPYVVTKCCSRAHCWKCKTAAHGSTSCEEMNQSLDNTLIPCPSCGAILTKGDGCSSITCLCGHNFNWDHEKRKKSQLQKFLELFPSPDTHLKCAEVLLTAKDQKVKGVELHYPDILRCADVWMSNHVVDVNNCLLQWWLEHYRRYSEEEMVRIVRGYSKRSMSRGWCCARDLYLASKKDGGGCQVTESEDDAHNEKTVG